MTRCLLAFHSIIQMQFPITQQHDNVAEADYAPTYCPPAPKKWLILVITLLFSEVNAIIFSNACTTYQIFDLKLGVFLLLRPWEKPQSQYVEHLLCIFEGQSVTPPPPQKKWAKIVVRPSSAIYNSKHANLIGPFLTARTFYLSSAESAALECQVTTNVSDFQSHLHLEGRAFGATQSALDVWSCRNALSVFKEGLPLGKSVESKSCTPAGGCRGEQSHKWLDFCSGTISNRQSLNSCALTSVRIWLPQFKCSTIGVFLTCQTFVSSCGSRQLESPGRSPSGGLVESGLEGINRAKTTDSAALGLSRYNIFTSTGYMFFGWYMELISDIIIGSRQP